jgi:hypothetical protein
MNETVEPEILQSVMKTYDDRNKGKKRFGNSAYASFNLSQF